MTPTSQQTAFLAALIGTTNHLALVARAGCGKTSTILMGVDAAVRQDPRAEIVVCAYNRAIADEVKEKLARAGHTNWKQVQATTLHGLGFGLVRFVFKVGDPTDKKVRNLIDGQNSLVFTQWGYQIEQLVGVAKQAGVGFFPDLPIANVQVWHDLANHFDINGVDDQYQMEEIVEAAQHIYKLSLAQTDIIDFDDMILFPLIKNLRVKFGKDIMFLDEAQDLSRARQALARKFLKPVTGRMIVVGDDRQAIYGFSGADAAALPNLIEQLSATVLPLSVTWRCPQAVVRIAQKYVPDIEAAPTAPEGEVLHLPALPEDMRATDAILCRNTAPLISLAYKMIRRGTACKVEGRAIGEGLLKLVGRWKIKTLDALINRLNDYKAREQQKALAKGDERKVEEVADRVDTLLEICAVCAERGEATVDAVRRRIEDLFADGVRGVLTLATYHRSKGREWDRVFLFEHDMRCPSKMAKQQWQKVQEANLSYVAVTRARQTLAFVG